MKAKISILLIAALALFSCDNEKQPNNPPLSEEDKIVNELMAQCQNFNAEDIMQGLLGEWIVDSYLIYDENWHRVTKVIQLMGAHHQIGGAEIEKYTFFSDGTVLYYTYIPGVGEISHTSDWQYDSENRKLILNGGWNRQYLVSGFNNEYIVLDIKVDNNVRSILKRKTE